jgi:hypothetical protein
MVWSALWTWQCGANSILDRVVVVARAEPGSENEGAERPVDTTAVVVASRSVRPHLDALAAAAVADSRTVRAYLDTTVAVAGSRTRAPAPRRGGGIVEITTEAVRRYEVEGRVEGGLGEVDAPSMAAWDELQPHPWRGGRRERWKVVRVAPR